MLTTICEMLSYPFLVRAVLVGLLVSLCSALLGTSLVMKRYSMIGDSLSHVGFAALAVAYAFNAAPLAVALPVCIAAAFFLLRRKETSHIKGDAATALLCSGALAVGVMTVSLTSGMNTDVCSYMFGSILAMSAEDVALSAVLSGCVLILFLVFNHQIFSVTFDEPFAHAIGIHTELYNMLIALLTAVTVVLGMRMMGALLISSLIVFPSLSAMRICKRYKTVVVLSVFLSAVCFLVGITASYLYSTPTGASIVIVNAVAFCMLSFAQRCREGWRSA
jgi:zinc transport system permease protein